MIVLVAAVLLAAQTPELTPPAVPEPLQAIRALFDDVECARLFEALPGLYALPALTVGQRVEARFMEASCLVSVGNLDDASTILAALVHDDVDVAPPPTLDPRIPLLLRTLRDAELKAREDVRQRRLDEIRASVKLQVTPPTGVVGGQRASFVAAVDDPRGVVKSLRVDFRRKDDVEFFSLPFEKGKDGLWRGEVPGAYTRTARESIEIRWFVTASGDDGEALQSHGNRAAPQIFTVYQGSDIATDLAARERLPRGSRLLFTFFGVPAVVASPFLLTGIAAVVVGTFSEALFPFAAVLSGYLGGVLAAGAGLAATEYIVDDWTKYIPATWAAIVGLGYGTALWLNVGELGQNDLGPIVGAGVCAVLMAPVGIAPTLAVAFEAHDAE